MPHFVIKPDADAESQRMVMYMVYSRENRLHSLTLALLIYTVCWVCWVETYDLSTPLEILPTIEAMAFLHALTCAVYVVTNDSALKHYKQRGYLAEIPDGAIWDFYCQATRLVNRLSGKERHQENVVLFATLRMLLRQYDRLDGYGPSEAAVYEAEASGMIDRMDRQIARLQPEGT